MRYLSLEHPEERKHKDESDGGRGNYNERFLMDPLRSILAILAMRRVPTLYSNETIKINCSSYNFSQVSWSICLVLLSSCFLRIFLVVLGFFRFFLFFFFTLHLMLKINKTLISKIVKYDYCDLNCFDQIRNADLILIMKCINLHLKTSIGKQAKKKNDNLHEMNFKYVN